MNKFTESIQKEAHATFLTDAERSSMLARIESAMQTDKAYIESPLFAVPIRTPFTFSSRLVYAFAVFVLMIGISGGTTFAAGSALPGDFLYSIKTGVNEPVVGALAVSEEAKAIWHAEVATERLKEAATLSSEGRLTASTSAALATAFTVHAAQAESITNSLAAANPTSAAKLATAFSTTIGEQSSAILAAGGANQSAGNSVASSDLVHAVITQKVQSDTAELALTDEVSASQATTAASPDMSVTSSSATSVEAVVAVSTTTSTAGIVPTAKIMMTLAAPVMMESKANVAPVMFAKQAVVVTPTLDAVFASKNEEAVQFVATNSTLLSASTTAYADSELADIKLVPIQVEADRSTADESAATHDLRVGIARINRLSLLLHAEATSAAVKHSQNMSATSTANTSSWAHK
jgi:hypothetical protein